MTPQFDETYWNERYGEGAAVWSGHPNPQLVAEASTLPPGTALDAGCGEGADAAWLAGQGWQVTGVDFSQVALDRAAAHVGDDAVSGRITWARHDLVSWTPPRAAFDLVSAQYMHLPRAEREPLFARLADAVAPGGTLLLVGHAGSDLHFAARLHQHPDLSFTPEEVAATLEPSRWRVLVAESRPRPGTGRGQDTIQDTVLRAVRT
ncbi:class I SAM-dependent methyltransferase [Specibacter sp. RAF43]|uniref:class I SAM-dependent methyltransferase n=1 Tax=Specibacter sp. RAF43 TaxID=3233057 RepID=UPI003F9DA359